MPIFDLANAKPLEGYKQSPRRGKRTLGEGNTPAFLAGGYGGGTSFAGAKVGRLLADFVSRSNSADQDLFGANKLMRARARELAESNPHARKFVWMFKQNVVGPKGIQMKSKVIGANGNDTAATDKINQRIDEEWKRWCKKGRCTADGKFDFVQYQQLAAGTVAKEGENLVKYVYGREFNDTGFALQPLDNDQLDDTLMTQSTDGSEIRMGVEVNKYRRPVAYWLWSGHPNDLIATSRERKRVPSAYICHTAFWERPGQTRGYTWLSASLIPMKNHGGWSEASLVAARASAAKFGVITEEYADGFDGDEDYDGDDTNADGTQVMSANPGEFLQLDPGQKFDYTDPRFPMTSYKEYSKSMLQEICSGLLVSYPSLASDLEGVNFSSIRAGLIDERDMWRMVQRFFVNDFLEPIRMAWLKMALLTTLSDITLTPVQMDQVAWNARGWEWVDPQKDAAATILKLGEGLSTYEEESGKLGYDWQEIALQRKREQEFFDENGIVYGVDISGDQGGKGVSAGDEKEAAEVSGAKDGTAGGGAKQGNGGKAK